MSIERDLHALKRVLDAMNMVDPSKLKHKEGIDKDFLNMFFDMSRDVYENDILALWSSLLTNEIENPLSVNRRILNQVRDIPISVIRKFNNAAPYIFNNYLFSIGLDYNLVQCVDMNDISEFKEYGLISYSDSIIKLNAKKLENPHYFHLSHDDALLVLCEEERLIAVNMLNSLGKIICKQTDNVVDNDFLTRLSNYFQSKGAILIRHYKNDKEIDLFRSINFNETT